MKSIDPSSLAVPQLHQYLLGVVAPRPIAFASTVDAQGNPNLAPFSFFNVFSANPPVVVFSPARRGRDNTTKDTLENLRVVGECVIHVVNHALVHQASLASTEYPRGVNEFVKAGLTPIPSEVVRPPRVKESPAHLECRVKQIIELGSGGGAGNLVICEVVRLHLDESVLDAQGRVDPRKIDQVARMGGSWYTRASSGLFELPQPTRERGIGFDQLTADVLRSPVLTGSQLAVLAGVEHLPDETAVNEYKLTELAELFLDLEHDAHALERRLHERAARLVEEGRVEEAWKTLLAFNN